MALNTVWAADTDGDLHLVVELGNATQVRDRLASETLCGMDRAGGVLNQTEVGTLDADDERICAKCVNQAKRDGLGVPAMNEAEPTATTTSRSTAAAEPKVPEKK